MFWLFRSTKEWIKEIPLPSRPKLEIRLGSADFVVKGGAEGKLKLTLKYEASPGEEARIEHVLEHILLREEEGTLHIGLPKALDGLIAEARLEVPKELELSIVGGSGDLELERLSGNVQVSLGSGDVKGEELQGSLILRTTSGDVQLSRVYGALEMALTSGDVQGRDVKGSVRVKTGSGDVFLDGFHGDLDVSTGSGDVDVEGSMDEGGEWRIRTGSGDVSLKVPKDLGLAVDLVSSSGDVVCTLPVSAQRMEEGRVQGTLGQEPKGSLRVATGSGDIHVQQSGDL